jgi:formylmethanofuran dehydrogenase subunit E
MEKNKRILAKFDKLGIDPKKWVYVGCSYKNIIADSLFVSNFPDIDEYPEIKDRCVCGAKIKENYYITTRDLNYDNLTVIGSECYKLFIDNKTIRCIVCNEEHTDTMTKNPNYRHLCKTCANTKKQYIKNNKKALITAHDDLINKYRVELNIIYNNYNYDVSELFNKFKRKRDDINEQERYKKRGKYHVYLNKIISKKADILLNEYRESLNFHFTDLNWQYKIKHNSFEIFNKFNKIKESKKYIRFVNKEEYKIACIYVNFKHVLTINLTTMQQTKNSPNLIKFN